jgi:hypothetical protein
MAEGDSLETDVGIAYMVLEALEDRNNGDPVKLELIIDELRTRKQTSQLGGRSFEEREADRLLRTLIHRNLVHETSPDAFSTYLEPEDVGLERAKSEEKAAEPLLEFGKTIDEFVKPMEQIRSYYGWMTGLLILAGIGYLLFLYGNFNDRPLNLTLAGTVLSLTLIGVPILATRKTRIFEDFEDLGDEAHEFVHSFNFEMTKPVGQNTAQRILYQLRRAGHDYKELDSELKLHPDGLKYDYEFEGKKGKHKFDISYHRPTSLWVRWLRRNFWRMKQGVFLLVRIYEKEVTEDDLENLRDEIEDLSQTAREIPGQVVVVSKLGFTRRAYGWANRDENSIRMEEDSEEETPIELVQETPAGTFKIAW